MTWLCTNSSYNATDFYRVNITLIVTGERLENFRGDDDDDVPSVDQFKPVILEVLESEGEPL